MTLEQIKILAAVVEQGSVKKAAEIMHKTQPALSMSIQKLENELVLGLCLNTILPLLFTRQTIKKILRWRLSAD